MPLDTTPTTAQRLASSQACGNAPDRRAAEGCEATMNQQQHATLSIAIEARYRATLSSVGDAVISTSEQGRVDFMNPVAERLTAWTEAEARGKPLDEIFRIVNEETRAVVENPVDRVLREGAVVGLANHTLLIARDGTEHPIADSAAPIRDERGATTGVVLVFRDQTQERQAQQALRDSERKFRETIEHLDEGYYCCTADGLVLEHNLAFNRILGFGTAQDMRGAKLPEFWQNPDDRREYLNELMTQGSIENYLIHAKTAGGDKVVVMASSHLEKDDQGRLARIVGTFTDFTKQHGLEAELKESEAKYRSLFDNAEVGMYRSKLDGSGIITLNQRLADIFGFTTAEMLRSPATIRWADPKAREEMVGVLRERGELCDHELDIVTKGGEVRTVLASMKLYPDKGYLEGTAIDITDRKHAEEALRESEAKYRTLVENIPQGIFMKDRKFRWVSINENFARNLGVRPSDIVGKVDRDLFPIDIADKYHADDIRIMETGQTEEFEEESILGGRHVWVNTIKTPVLDKNGEIVGVLGVFWDITDRRHAEEALRESERRLRELTESLPQLIWTCRADGPCDYLSPQWVAYTGIPEQEQLGFGWLEQIHSEDRAPTVVRWNAAVGAGSAFDIEFRIRRSDGVYRWFKTSALPLRDREGRVVKWLGTNSDIEDQRRAEDQVRRSLVELQRSNQDLEQFAYVASHDLQEPLRMVASYTQLLAEKYEGQLDDKAKKYIDYAVDGAVRMQRLVNDLLSYSRISTKGRAPEPTDSHAVLGEALGNLQTAIEESRAMVTNDDLPVVRADATQLLQVFQNLIANAIKFRRGDPPRVHVAARDGGHEWEFSVKDNGIGIDAQYANRVFVIFQRLHARPEYPGTGIGLAVCKRIVERHGGRIWLESEPGKGSTFFFTVSK
jgi:PAS domain S-box-containing protein